jgi:hypothetical protein
MAKNKTPPNLENLETFCRWRLREELTSRRIRQLKKDGKIKVDIVKGELDPVNALQELLFYYKRGYEGKLEGKAEDLDGKKLDNEKKFIELQILKGTVLEREDVQKSFDKALMMFKSIRVLPKKYSPQVLDFCLSFINKVMVKKRIKKTEIPAAAKKDLLIAVEDILQEEIDGALRTLAQALPYGEEKPKQIWGKGK